MSLQCKGQNLSWALPWTPTQALLWICCRVTAPWDPHLHFAIFKNSIFVKKTDISRTASLNPCPRGIIILHLCTKNDNHMMYGRVQLNRLSFVTQNKVLNFHDWTLFYHEPSRQNEKTKIIAIIYGSMTFE